MTHILEMFPPTKYVAAFELKGADTTLTIKSVRAEIIEGENNRKDKRPIIYFEEGGKPLVLNKTNAKILIKLYGADISQWPGKRVTIYPTVVDAFGEKVEAIRLRKQVPSGPARKAAAEEKTLPERVEAFKATLKEKNTIVGVDTLAKHAKTVALLAEVDPETRDELELLIEARSSELKEAR